MFRPSTVLCVEPSSSFGSSPTSWRGYARADTLVPCRRWNNLTAILAFVGHSWCWYAARETPGQARTH